MYEYKNVAVVQRGEIRELFPGGNLRGGKRSELRSPRISPSRSPFLGTLFWSVRCGVCDVFGGAMDSTVSRTPG